LFGVLGEYRIARFGRFYKEVGGFTWRGVWLWRISGS